MAGGVDSGRTDVHAFQELNDRAATCREGRGQAFEDGWGIQARGMASPKHRPRPRVGPGAAGTVIEGVWNEVPH